MGGGPGRAVVPQALVLSPSSQCPLCIRLTALRTSAWDPIVSPKHGLPWWRGRSGGGSLGCNVHFFGLVGEPMKTVLLLQGLCLRLSALPTIFGA